MRTTPRSRPVRGNFFLEKSPALAFPCVMFEHDDFDPSKVRQLNIAKIYPQDWWEKAIKNSEVMDYVAGVAVEKFEMNIGIRYRWFFYPITVVWIIKRFSLGKVTYVHDEKTNAMVPVAVNIHATFKDAEKIMIYSRKERYAFLLLRFWFGLEQILKNIFGKNMHYARLNSSKWYEFKMLTKNKEA